MGGSAHGILPGPGPALELHHGAHKGRLVFCGHYGAYRYDTTWYSDDGGKTYARSAQTLEKMDECALVELSDGTVQLNMRNNHITNCDCRATSLSKDGGETWGAITYQDALISPVCQASI